MISKIKALAKTHTARIVEIRRHLHRHPELSFIEHKTAEYVKACLLYTSPSPRDQRGSRMPSSA